MRTLEQIQRANKLGAGRRIRMGQFFSWSETRGGMEFTGKDLCGGTLTIHDGLFVHGQRPRKWWHLRSWYRLNKLMWKTLPE